MEKLAFVDILAGRDRFFLPLMKVLGPERAVYYYRPQTSADFFAESHAGGSKGFENDSFEAVLNKIRSLGIEIVADDEHYSRALVGHNYFLTDFTIKEFYWEKHPFRNKNKRHICYTHSADDCPWQGGALSDQDFFLATTEEMLYNFVGSGKFLCTQDGTVEVGRAPEGAEGVIVGLMHVGEEVKALAARDKKELRAELAEKLGVRFKPELPLLTYMMNLYADARAEDRGLERLGRQANIVIKGTSQKYDPAGGGERPYSAISLARGETIHHTEDGGLMWLMRYAADVNLTNPMGASNLTAVLLGLRQITTYTRQVMGVVPPQPINFSHLLRDTRRIQTKLAYCVAPIPIEATEMLMERINDSEYWERYDREIGQVARSLVGRYYSGQEALDRAAGYIRRMLDRGTFTPTPQELPNAKVGQGPATMGFPLDFTL